MASILRTIERAMLRKGWNGSQNLVRDFRAGMPKRIKGYFRRKKSWE